MTTRKEFGDFQTPRQLAERVVNRVDQLFGEPDVIVEPTAGLGAFLAAAAARWADGAEYYGYELNPTYVARCRKALSSVPARIIQRNFFEEDWSVNLSSLPGKRLLVLGNPPWVTNSGLGQIGGGNLPVKSNSEGLCGLDALTGKANFDIAEWIIVRLIEALPSNGAIAMLCKTMTARKVLRRFWATGQGPKRASIHLIDAKHEFGVSVDACLFCATGTMTRNCVAKVFPTIEAHSPMSQFGYESGGLVADIEKYRANADLDGGDNLYSWRSGLKHDATSVMELHRADDFLTNGFGDRVSIEPERVFPLLKSSDIAAGRTCPRRVVLVTQSAIGDDTSQIERTAPKTWRYLLKHAANLDNRKSSIYRGRPRFSIFGIGPYSFAPWKVAISGLYKKLQFTVVGPFEGKPVMLDDTCYFIGCGTKSEALLIHRLLSTDAAQAFLESLVFFDSKRPITIDVLRRLSLIALAKREGALRDLIGNAPTESVGLFEAMSAAG